MWTLIIRRDTDGPWQTATFEGRGAAIAQRERELTRDRHLMSLPPIRRPGKYDRILWTAIASAR